VFKNNLASLFSYKMHVLKKERNLKEKKWGEGGLER
jgi:hypothetical protein